MFESNATMNEPMSEFGACYGLNMNNLPEVIERWTEKVISSSVRAKEAVKKSR